MANPLARLLGRKRDASREASVAGLPAVADESSLVDEDLPLASAVAEPRRMLLPAAIFHQLLYDPAEHAPAWLTRRPEPSSSVTTAAGTAIAQVAPAVKPKATRRTPRPKANGSTTPARPRTKRATKADPTVNPH